MRFVVSLFDPFHCDMSVNLGRREVDVSEQGLNAAQISAVIQKMGGKAVPEFVGADAELDGSLG